MFKNSPYICYTFFAIDDVIVTSVNNYTSIMRISTEEKYLIKSLQENKKYGATAPLYPLQDFKALYKYCIIIIIIIIKAQRVS